jgi:hypothetical protein
MHQVSAKVVPSLLTDDIEHQRVSFCKNPLQTTNEGKLF